MGRLCSGIFLVQQGQYFLVNISALLFSISGGSETNSNHHDFAKLSFKFNFNSVKSWDNFIINSSMPPTHSNFELVSEPPNPLNKSAKTFTRNYCTCRTKKNSWAKMSQANHLIIKASAHKLPSSNNWKRKLCIKHYFGLKKDLFVLCVFFGQHCRNVRVTFLTIFVTIWCITVKN